jgi:hypothetical protein
VGFSIQIENWVIWPDSPLRGTGISFAYARTMPGICQTYALAGIDNDNENHSQDCLGRICTCNNRARYVWKMYEIGRNRKPMAARKYVGLCQSNPPVLTQLY